MRVSEGPRPPCSGQGLFFLLRRDWSPLCTALIKTLCLSSLPAFWHSEVGGGGRIPLCHIFSILRPIPTLHPNSPLTGGLQSVASSFPALAFASVSSRLGSFLSMPLLLARTLPAAPAPPANPKRSGSVWRRCADCCIIYPYQVQEMLLY